VAAQNLVATGLFSSAISVRTLGAAPDAVGSPIVTDVGATFLNVSWQTPNANGEALTGYRVFVCDVPLSAQEQCIAHDVAVSPTSTILDQLTPGRNFTVRVQAVNGLGTSPNQTAPGLHTTHDVPLQCNAPSRHTPPLEGLPPASTLHIEWPAPFNNGAAILHYNLTIVDLATSRVETAIVPHHSGQILYDFVKTGLFPGSSHAFSVAAVNAIGQGAFSASQELTTVQDVPGTPGAPSLVLEPSSSITIGLRQAPFDGGMAIVSYDVRINFGSDELTRSVSASDPQLQLTVNPRNPFATCVQGARQRTCSPIDSLCSLLSCVDRYQFRSAAVNVNGQRGGWSEPLLVGPLTAQFPNAPMDLTRSGVTSRSFVLGWSMRNDALSLDVQSYVLSLTSATLSTSQLQTLTNLSSCIGGCSALIDASVADLRPATTCALDDPVSQSPLLSVDVRCA
jgi:hypothetical protein